jgi:hypothetical protein
MSKKYTWRNRNQFKEKGSISYEKVHTFLPPCIISMFDKNILFGPRKHIALTLHTITE